MAALAAYIIRLRSTGHILGFGVGIFSDAAATQGITSVSWGTIYQAQNVSKTVYVKNIGAVGTTLSIDVGNFAPDTMKVLQISTDYKGQVLSVGQVLALVLTLAIPSTAPLGDFGFDIVFTANASL